MSDPAQPAPDSDDIHTGPPVSETVRQAVESGVDVNERVREIVVGLFRGTGSTTASARAAVQGIVQTATDIVKRSAPDKADSVLRQVIDGITTGLSSVAQSTQYAVQEATSRGQRFAAEDVGRARKDLNGIREILTDTVRHFTNRASTETGSVVSELRTHAERAANAAIPLVSSSLEALARQPLQAAGEAAGSALRGGQLTAGALLNAVSGALAGAAELMDPNRRKTASPKDVKDPVDS